MNVLWVGLGWTVPSADGCGVCELHATLSLGEWSTYLLMYANAKELRPFIKEKETLGGNN